MKNPFKKETVQYKAEVSKTPYQRAGQEWDERMGGARVQAENWRFVAVLSIVVALLLLVMLIVSLSVSQDRVFIAQVTKGGRVVNVAPLTKPYQPNQAQEEYFITRFVKLIQEVPLDPVVAKQNWTNAYYFLSRRGAEQLNAYMRQYNPIKLLGKKTATIKITDINPVSDETYHVTWEETTVDLDGKVEGQKTLSGVFTVMVKQPTTQEDILRNPLGIYIIDFHISSREA